MYEFLNSMFLFIYGIPPWLITLIKIGVLLLALEAGFRVGRKKYRAEGDSIDPGGNVILTATLGVLGLIFAFTFSASVQRHDLRKQELVMEANTIGTAFLRADLIAQPEKTQIKKILLDYANLRVVPAEGDLGPNHQREIIQASNDIIADLWPTAMTAISKSEQSGAVQASLISAVNEVIDQGTVRNAAVLNRLPASLLLMLIIITSLAMVEAGYKSGLKGEINRFRYGAFVFVLAVVMMAITDYDRPQDGVIRIDQSIMQNSINEMEKWFDNQ